MQMAMREMGETSALRTLLDWIRITRLLYANENRQVLMGRTVEKASTKLKPLLQFLIERE